MNEMVDEMVVMMKMRWNKERKRNFFLLENMRCQVTLIFTSSFLYETANQRLVFRLIHLFFFFSFSFFKIEIERNRD